MALPPPLPWAVSVPAEEKQEESSSEDEEIDTVCVPLSAVELEIGSTIEVKWEVETENEEVHYKWWPATVHLLEATAVSETEEAHVPKYELRYEAHDSFEAEVSEVVFVDFHSLVDVGSDLDMAWRKAGDTWEPEDDATLDALMINPGHTYSYGFDTQAEYAANRQALVEDAKAMMTGKSGAQQIIIAEGLAEFRRKMEDVIKKGVENAEARANGGGEVIVCQQDLEDGLRELRESQDKKRARMM